MADSGALRQQRYKHHRQGDHHLCKHEQIGNAIADFGPPGDPGDDLDPAAELRALAGRLAAVHQEDPSRADIARELRATLLAIQVPDEDTELAELMRGFADT
jgi:hypothetical protein